MLGLIENVIGVVFSTYVLLYALLRSTQDASEPPAMATTIPFVSPILGMKKRNSSYYNYLRDKYSQPIFTLRLPFTRLYIVTSTSLIPAIQRQFRVLSFNPVQIKAATNLAGLSREGLNFLARDIDNDKGFIPGTMLDTLNQKTVSVILDSFNELAERGTSCTVDLYKWVGEQITYATTDANYGPHNPLRDPQCLEDGSTVYEAKTMTLVMGILPSLLAADAIKARAFLCKKYEYYFSQGYHLEASNYIQHRYAYMRERGLSAEDCAKLDLTGVFPLVGNTISSAFWLVYRIFSSPDVFQDCYNEVSRAVSEENDSCPILSSTYQEAFRFHGMATSVRVALEDHLREGKHLIKKGGMVMISAHVQHTDSNLRGTDVTEFRHTRFLKSSENNRQNPVAFRGFGGGTTLCPGRHFATTEILLFATLLMLRFDVRLQTAEAMGNLAMYDIRIELLPKPKQKWQVVSPNRTNSKTRLVAEDFM
ncbi:cytochrome P450 [Xylariaceae sp. FL1272]|nr:cytochrome P450 [Xylariaceae sp. FL1272]